MSPYKNIAVAGATGNLGPTVVDALVTAGFHVTVLSRSGSASNLPSGVKVVKVDYDSQESLVAALKGQDAFVSNIPNHIDQPKLIDAAITAGVERFIPSEFGSNVSGNENNQKLPVFQGKLKTQQYLHEREDKISYTLIVTGAFLDWGIKVGFLINAKGGPTRLYDGGNRPRSTTTLADIAKAVVGVLNNPDETKNRTVFVESAAVSQKQLLELAKKKNPDLKVETEEVDTSKLLEESHALLGQKDADIGQAMIGFIIVSIHADAHGGRFAKNDNELLGIKPKSEPELEALVAQYA
ncbi:hypothetical protein MBLNU459_g0961t1 [Dothideomycetes sp. NU459]